MTEPSHIADLLERAARLLLADAQKGGLKPVQWEALRYLARANRFSRTPGAVTAYLGLTKGTVSQTLMSLERKGLVEKQSAGADKRQVQLALTATGRAMLADDSLSGIRATIETLESGTQGDLAAGLEQFVRARLARQGGRPFGLCRDCRFFRRDDLQGAPHRCALLNVALSDADSSQICQEQEAA